MAAGWVVDLDGPVTTLCIRVTSFEAGKGIEIHHAKIYDLGQILAKFIMQIDPVGRHS